MTQLFVVRDGLTGKRFAKPQTPADLGTIADLSRLPAMFSARGFNEVDVKLIMHGNFIRFLKEAWS